MRSPNKPAMTAAERFHDLIRQPFIRWCEGRG